MTVKAEVVAHSVDEKGNEVVTFNIEYGLIVHAEFLRHRLFSNSVKSNRAIPMKTLRKEVMSKPYVPVYFGAAQSGMQATKEVGKKWLAKALWKGARYPACAAHWLAEKTGAHKEWANRLLNPWQYVRETVTATDWDNFYALRIHPDAQKDIQVIAREMWKACKSSSPQLLKEGEWHTPYVISARDLDTGELKYYDNDGREVTSEEAVKASTARCARSSYDNHDKTNASLASDLKLYNILIDSKPTHGSPAEHQATPVTEGLEGVTHADREGNLWSGNFKNWVQHRQLLKDHVIWEYEEKQ